MTDAPELPREQPAPSAAPPRGPGWWTAFFLSTGVFAFGTVFGTVSTLVVLKHMAPWRFDAPQFQADRMAARLANDLDLSPEQAERVRDVFRSQHEKLEAIRSETGPRIRAALDETHDLVMAELTPDQQSRWDQKFELMRRRMRAPGWDHSNREGRSRSFQFGDLLRGNPETKPPAMRHDRDGDTKLDFEEASQAWPRLTLERFGRMDANRDGALDSTEIEAAQRGADKPEPPEASDSETPIE